jgi:hypothetical protein
MTDGRGAVTTYTYNSRGLVTNLAWAVGSTGIVDPADVTYTYDNLGNRTNMDDGPGEVDYEYNSLSQLTAEVRDFDDTLSEAPNGVFRLEYTYQIGGQLKSYTDPYEDEIAYSHDKLGRLGTVNGSSFASITSYASNPHYRAWGALESVENGSGMKSVLTFDDRLRASNHEVRTISTPVSKLFDKDYEYYADGKLKMIDETAGENIFDRSFTYDHQGRIKDAKSAIEADGQTETNLENLPYRQTYTFDAFGNITNRQSTLWDYEGGWNFSHTVTNNRVTGHVYDADGRVVSTGLTETHYQYDATGSMVETRLSVRIEYG